MNKAVSPFIFDPNPPFGFCPQPTNRQITVPSQSESPIVNGIATVSPGPIASSPALAARAYPVLVDFLVQLHSTNARLATEMFLQSWDEDRERAMSFIGALLHSRKSYLLESFIRALFQSRENSLGEITRLLMLMHRN